LQVVVETRSDVRLLRAGNTIVAPVAALSTAEHSANSLCRRHEIVGIADWNLHTAKSIDLRDERCQALTRRSRVVGRHRIQGVVQLGE
jgi:hypothetical protein